ncbi:MAG: Ig-like domain-containing protein, partial [Bacteroidales bacterium]
AGTYTYTVTNAAGCISAASGNIVITAQPATPTATASSNGPLIPGTLLSLTGGPGGMTGYAWTGPNGFISAAQSPVVSTNATIDMAGIYTLTVTNSNGCQSSATTTVASNPLIVTNVNDNGIGSLRYAIDYANSTVGVKDIITFNIPGYGPFTIQPQTALSAIKDPIIIDGYSQSGASAKNSILLIEIDGTNAGTVSNGLTISGGGSIVKGLIINNFKGAGIQITGSGANSILGNYIGIDFSGTVPKGNSGDGIQINGSSNNIIGGTNPGEGNLITGNTGAGISILNTGAIGNLISSNSIYSNGKLGVNLVGGVEDNKGVTNNDTGDGDNGPNNLQNFPVLGSLIFSTGSVTISGTLNSQASKTYNLQFFANKMADNSGYGEGQTYLGSKTVTTNSTGNAVFTQDFAIKSSSGTVITANATDPLGNTSEFSKAIGAFQNQIVGSWPFSYTLNKDGVPNITDGSDLDAVRASFQTWSDISTADIQFVDAGTTTSKYANANDGVNLVSFEDDQFPFGYGVLAVAAKTLKIDPTTQVAQIIDADIVVNPEFVNDVKYNLGVGYNNKDAGYFDIQSVLTHEIGHVLGLLHSGIVSSTMFFTMGSGITVRTLEQDDISWASYTYPNQPLYNNTYGSISGNITYGYGGQPVAGALVYAINTATNDSVHAYSDALGNYLVPGLISGSYYIYIEPLDGDVHGYNLRPANISSYIYSNTIYTDYPGEFYNNPDLADEPDDSKSIVTVNAGLTTSGINLITNRDNIRPTVISVSPTDVSGTMINILSNFSIKFSETVDETSLSTGSCYLTTGTKTIGGSYTILGNNVVLFDPESVLDYTTDYTLHITTGVKDLRGNSLLILSGGQELNEFTQSFTTIPKDIVPPEINEVIPASGATNVFVMDKIIVFFSEPMNKSSVEKGFTLNSGGTATAGSFSWDDANKVVTFSPYTSLKEAKTVYTITLPGSITDLAGNPLSGISYSFTTVATAPPTITYLGPANNSTGVPVTTPIVADFSEPINTYTVMSTTFKLLLGTTNTTIPGQFEFLNENSRVIFTPAANLNFNQSYTISLTAGIQDISLPKSSSLSPTTSTFTTAATVTVPDILYLDPSNGVTGDKVVITGTGFDPNPVNNIVTFNGINASVTSAALTSLTTVVPMGVLSGPVAVTINGTVSDNTMYFGVIPQSLNPCSDIIGSKSTGSSSGHSVDITEALSVNGVPSTYAYVTNPEQGTVSVVNLTTSETISPITVGDTPINIAINPQGTKAYVTNFNSHTVSVIDLVKGSTYNKVIKTIPVGIEPYGLAVTPNGKRVYVANYYSGNLSMIDEDPNSGGFDHVVANISTGSKTGNAAITPDGAMVLVTGDFGLKIIDANPADKDYNSVIANVSTGSKANGVTATGDAALAIVSTEDGHLMMINLHPENGDYSEAIIANVSTGTSGGKANASGDNLFVYLPDTKNNQILVYQIGIGAGGSGTSNGSGISGLTLIPHNKIPIPTAPVALAISSDASRLYVLDTKTGTSTNEITSVAICCGPISPSKVIGDLIITIQDMINTGDITKLRGYALIVILNSSLSDIYANRTKLATADLTAFTALVNTYIKNKQISSAVGNALVSSANSIITQLKGTKSSLAGANLPDAEQANLDMIPASNFGVIYPNPFGESVTINYQIAENNEAPTEVQIMVYDENGRLINTLVDRTMQQGCYSVLWRGTYGNGSRVPYGSYIVKFRAGDLEQARKIILIKQR